MKIFRLDSLQRVLILPFVLLVTLLALVLGWLSYRAGESAADDLSRRVVLDMMARIRLAADEQLNRSATVLRILAPDPEVPSAGPASVVRFPERLIDLEERGAMLESGVRPEV